jgi:hypothetical protein
VASIKYRVSSIEYQVSSIKYRVSSIEYRVSSIEEQGTSSGSGFGAFAGMGSGKMPAQNRRSDWCRFACGKGEMTGVIPLQGETAGSVPQQLRAGRLRTQGISPQRHKVTEKSCRQDVGVAEVFHHTSN